MPVASQLPTKSGHQDRGSIRLDHRTGAWPEATRANPAQGASSEPARGVRPSARDIASERPPCRRDRCRRSGIARGEDRAKGSVVRVAERRSAPTSTVRRPRRSPAPTAPGAGPAPRTTWEPAPLTVRGGSPLVNTTWASGTLPLRAAGRHLRQCDQFVGKYAGSNSTPRGSVCALTYATETRNSTTAFAGTVALMLFLVDEVRFVQTFKSW